MLPHVLVVDDHREIREGLARYLRRHGFRTSMAADAAEARRVLARHAVDLVVLDIMLPGEDGLALCRELRARRGPPVVFLSALGEETDRIVGLELGADDYVPKPFNPRELLARIRAVLRRVHSLPPGRRTERGRFRFRPWTFDAARGELEHEDGRVVSLSTAETRLLAAFVRHPGVVLSREELLDVARGREPGPFDRSVDNLVSRLRRKLGDDARRPRFVRTERTGGYAFIAPVEEVLCDSSPAV